MYTLIGNPNFRHIIAWIILLNTKTTAINCLFLADAIFWRPIAKELFTTMINAKMRLSLQFHFSPTINWILMQNPETCPPHKDTKNTEVAIAISSAMAGEFIFLIFATNLQKSYSHSSKNRASNRTSKKV